MITAFLLSTNSAENGLLYYTRTLMRALSAKGIRSVIADSVSCDCDLLHVQHVFGYNDRDVLGQIRAFKKKGASVFITLHSLNSVLTREQESFIRAAAKQCDCLCVHYKYQRDIIHTYLGKRQKVDIVAYPAEPEKKAAGGNTEKTILLCGFIKPTKGFHRVVSLFPEIVRKIPDARLLIAGRFKKDAWNIYKRDFFELVRKSPVKDRIIVKNRLFSEQQFVELLDSARVVVLPYEAGEHVGVFHQCLACGKQVITSDLPGFVEKQEQEKDHFIVKNDRELFQTLVFCLAHK